MCNPLFSSHSCNGIHPICPRPPTRQSIRIDRIGTTSDQLPFDLSQTPTYIITRIRIHPVRSANRTSSSPIKITYIHNPNLQTQSFNQMASRLASGDTSFLAEMHATTSGLKVLISTIGINDIEIARRSMGGHGYSAFSGLGKLYAEYLPSAT